MNEFPTLPICPNYSWIKQAQWDPTALVCTVQVMEEEGRTEVARFGAGKPTRTIISGTDQLR